MGNRLVFAIVLSKPPFIENIWKIWKRYIGENFLDHHETKMRGFETLRARMRDNQQKIKYFKSGRKMFLIFLLISPVFSIIDLWVFVVVAFSALVLFILVDIAQDDAKSKYKQDLCVYSRQMDENFLRKVDKDLQLLYDFLDINRLMNSKRNSTCNHKNSENCMICHTQLDSSSRKLKCPQCHAPAHKSHLLSWLKLNNFCPNCGTSISHKKFVGVNVNNQSFPLQITTKFQSKSPKKTHNPTFDLTIAHECDAGDVCSVCKLSIDTHEEEIWCPNCHTPAHRTHLLEWIKIKGFCPNCSTKLKLTDFISFNPTREFCYIQV